MCKRGIGMEIIHENHEKLDIIKGFWSINQRVREDCYNINSVKEIFDGFATVGTKEICRYNNNEMDEYVKNIDVLRERYRVIDEKLMNKSIKKELNDEVAVELELNDDYVEFEDGFTLLYNIMIECIVLSSDMQELLVNALKFIRDIRREFNEGLIKINSLDNLSYFSMRERDDIKNILKRSVQEDKIINYEVICSNTNKDYIKDFRKLVNKYGNVTLGNNKKIIIKKVDRTYVIDRLMEQVNNHYNYTTKIVESILSEKKERNVNRLNKNLFVINTVAPIIGGISISPIIYQIYKKYGWEELAIGSVLVIILIIILYCSIFNKKK